MLLLLLLLLMQMQAVQVQGYTPAGYYTHYEVLGWLVGC